MKNFLKYLCAIVIALLLIVPLFKDYKAEDLIIIELSMSIVAFIISACYYILNED